MRIATGQLMAQQFAGNRRLSPRATNALIFAGALLLAPAMFASAASAQVLGYASAPQSSFPSDNIMVTPDQPALSDDSDGIVKRAAGAAAPQPWSLSIPAKRPAP